MSDYPHVSLNTGRLCKLGTEQLRSYHVITANVWLSGLRLQSKHLCSLFSVPWLKLPYQVTSLADKVHANTDHFLALMLLSTPSKRSLKLPQLPPFPPSPITFLTVKVRTSDIYICHLVVVVRCPLSSHYYARFSSNNRINKSRKSLHYSSSVILACEGLNRTGFTPVTLLPLLFVQSNLPRFYSVLIT